MFVQKLATITLIAFILISNSSGRKRCNDSPGLDVWDGLSAKWAANPKDGFYDLPQSSKDAKDNGWTKISGVRVSNNVEALGYYNDPRIILLFDKVTGKVSGVQVAIPVDDIEDAGVPINYENNPAIMKQTLNGREFYTATAMFQENARTNTRRIWLKVNGTFEEYPTKPQLLTSQTPYFLKRCITWMGLHYYRIDPTSDCSNLFPWVFLRVKGDIIGLVFQAIGNSSYGNYRKWYEDIPLPQLAATIPDAPTCLVEGVANYGVISFHIWFKKNPLAITCSDECTAEFSANKSDRYDAGNERSRHNSGKRYKRAFGSGNVCPV